MRNVWSREKRVSSITEVEYRKISSYRAAYSIFWLYSALSPLIIMNPMSTIWLYYKLLCVNEYHYLEYLFS